MRLSKKIAMTIAALWCCMAVSAHNFEVDGIYYNITSRTSVEVTFRGTYNFSYSNEYVGKIVIPERVTYNDVSYIVTTIGDWAFFECIGLTSLTLPNSLTSIDSYAFSGCSGLTSITLPNSLTSIGTSAFYECSGLTSLTLPNSLTSIGDDAFFNCSGLTSITLPNSVSSIGEMTFYGCSSLTSLTLPNSVTSIGEGAFEYCSALTSITLPNSLTSIGSDAFYECSGLTSLTLPNSVTSIGEGAFSGCSGLTSIALPNSVTSIGEGAFYNCSGLTSIALPNSVTRIGSYAFSGCSGLTSITLPNSVTSIGEGAFSHCSGLTSLTLPNAVTSIGEEAFYGCINLKILVNLSNLSLSKGNTSNGYVAYYVNKIIEADEQIGDFCFKTSNNIHYLTGYIGTEKTLELPENYKGENYEIGKSAFFSCSGLISVTIPSSVTSIGAYAFESCDDLTSITLPNSLTSIGNYAFQYCGGLTSIILPNSLTSIGNYAFQYCGGLTSITLPNSVSSIGSQAFYGCSGLTSLTLPDSLTSIGEKTFYGCSGLTSLTLPNSVTSIGEQAFRACENLKTVINYSDLWLNKGSEFDGYVAYYADKVINADEQIGDFFFMTVENIHYLTGYLGTETDIKLPENYKGENYSIIGRSFEGDTELTSIVLPNSVTSIGESAFSGCSGLTSLTLPNSLTSIGNYAFYNCSGLTSLTLSNSLTSIGSYAFYGCSGLTSIVLPNSVTYIGEQAFYDCSNLKTVINLSNRNVSKGSSLDGYVAYYADKVINADEQIGDFFFMTVENIHYLTGYLGTETDIKLPENYKGENYSIIGRSFEGDTELTSITLPNSVTSIGEQAFYGCRGLTSIILPNSLTSIGEKTFYGCSGLTSLTLPNSLTSIGNYAFYNCSGLTSLTLPNSVTSIGEQAFYGCRGLTSIILPNSLTSIGNYAFYNCSGLTSLTLPNSVTSIGEQAFYGCRGLTSIILPNSLTSIGNYAFYNCSGLTSLTLSNSLTSIGSYAFYGCSGLTSIVLPNSVTYIGEQAFYDCSNLKTVINLSNRNVSKGSSLDGYVAYYADKVINADEQIGDFCFKTSNNIHYLTGYIGTEKTLELPENYKGENYAIGNKLFYECTNITNVRIPNSVTSIGSQAFYGCSGLTSITLSNSLTSIDSYAFSRCSGLTSITLPNSLTYIGEQAFYDCSNLKTVINLSNRNVSKGSSLDGYVAYYADKVINADEQIGDFFFKTSDNIHYLVDYLVTETDIKLPENYKGENYEIETKLFYNCTNITNVTIPNSVTSIGEQAFSGCSGLTNLTLPNSVTSIGDYAFSGCSGLTSLTLSNSLTSIGEQAFSGCSGLTSLTLSNSLTSIGEQAFSGCSGLTSLTLSNSLTSIGSYAFSGCSNLEEIHISSLAAWCNISFQELTSNPLYYANKLFIDGKLTTELTIPEGVTIITSNAFCNCSSLTSVNIPESVTSIGNFAFYGCSGLTSLILPNSLTRIGDRAFGGCENLKTVINYSDLWLNKGSELDGGVAYYADKVINADEQIGDFFFMTVENIHYLTGYLGTETDIKLPENYKGENYSIIGSLFEGDTELTSIIIPNSVEYINYNAFYGCENLKTVINFSNLSLSKGSEFDGYVAYYADKVINADEQIGEFFFKTSDNIHYLVAYVGTEPEIKLPENYKGENYAIGNKLFYNCTNITNVTIPNSVTSICESAFCNCISLTSIVLPNALHRIEDNAFNGCKGLTSIIIPNTVTHIGKDAFKGCGNLSDITLSNSVTRIGDSAFADTKWWDNQALGFVYLDNCLLGFKHNGTIPDNVELALNVTEGTRVIADNAFKNFNIITNVMIPNSLTHIGKYAFSNCNKLGNILIGESLEWIGEGAFLNCKGLSTVRVADIGTWYNIEFESREANPLYYARHLYKNTDEITDLEIPYSVNNYAFINCENLTSITLGANVSSLGEGAFEGCTNVTQIISNSPVPPICGIDALTDINKWNCTLKVVKGCKSAYQAADQWKEFFFIEDVVEIVYYALKFVVDGEVYHIDSLEFNEPIVFPEAPVKEGYTFSGWSEAPETMPAHDVTVTGSFEVDGIETIITNNLVDVYTLQGVIVKSRIPVETLREELSTGIYIVNGKKFVVK